VRGRLARPPALLVALLAALLTPAALGGDCNGNGVEDAEDVARGTSADCDGDQTPDECDVTPLAYVPRGSELATSEKPIAIASGDLDHDGGIDVVVANFTADTISVFTNDGDGELRAATELPAADGPVALAVADVDGDSHLDIIVTATSAHRLAWYAGAGDGSFKSPHELEALRSPRALVVEDLDGDGDLDLATSGAGSQDVSCFRNAGGGVFEPPAKAGVGRSPLAIAAADLDGDGRRELAVANLTGGTVSIVRRLGDWSFAESARLSTGNGPAAIDAADADGDSDADLFVANGASKTLSLELNDGTGAFPSRRVVPTPVSAASLTTVDLDGDLDLDVLFADRAGAFDAVRSCRMLPGGLLREPETLFETAAPAPPHAADLDGDGLVELLVASASSKALYVLSPAEDGNAGLPRRETLRDTGLEPHCIALADLDGDQDLDIAAGNGGAGTVYTYTNSGGSFTLDGSYTPGLYLLRMGVGDANGDGALDLAAGYQTIAILLNNGEGKLRSSGQIINTDLLNAILWTDLDGDGDADLVTSSSNVAGLFVHTNDGKAKFADPRRIRLPLVSLHADAADFDGDAVPDQVSASGANGAVTILHNRGGGSFDDPVTILAAGFASWVAATDLDGDGDLDLTTTGSSFFNDGDGRFEPGSRFPGASDPIYFTTADYNGDGISDVLTAEEFPGSVSIHTNDGHGRLFEGITFQVGAGVRAVLGGDIDGDGDTDLVTANRGGGEIGLLYNLSPNPATHLAEICSERNYFDVSVGAERPGEERRAGKVLLPARNDPSLLPVLFQNARRYSLHQDFLTQVFPDRFPALDGEQYLDLVARRATRQYFAGILSLFQASSGAYYGFSLFVDPSRPQELLSAAEVRGAYETLAAAFHLRPLAYVPDTRSAADEARKWVDPGFPVRFRDDPGVGYEAYTRGINFGTVRILELEEFLAANEAGLFSWQDILVLDHAPSDIDGVVAGVITEAPQGALSHLAVRTARRGTPNAFLANARAAFQSLEGKLVRLEVRGAEHFVTEASVEDAEAWWSATRPRLSEEPVVDLAETRLLSLLEIDGRPGQRPEARFGGKASHLARLQQVLTGNFARYREAGFAIPLRYYHEFLESNRMPSALDPLREVTYAEYLDEVLASDAHRADPALRFTALETFRNHAKEHGVVDPDLVARVAARMQETFGVAETMARFRSSSNVEDALEFNGAGLYESASACAADELDDDADGPSRCDPRKSRERTIVDGLRTVWSSLWTFRGHEERAFYQVPEERVAMGVLVTRAHIGERANGVAFTGNPSNSTDRRFIVTAQLGEESVVSPEPGVTAEIDALTITGGAVSKIDRVQGSSLAGGGQILTDVDLEELGAALAHIDTSFPVELGGHRRDEVFLDVEFKFTGDGSLAIKQVRPFLAAPPEPPGPTFELAVPAASYACGVFQVGRNLDQEQLLKSRILFREGRHILPTGPASFELDLVEELLIGPQAAPASPAGPGVMAYERVSPGNRRAVYNFTFEQPWSAPGGQAFRLRIAGLTFETRDGEPLDRMRTLDEDLLTQRLGIDAGPVDNEGRFVTYSSCTYDALDLWVIEAELEGGILLRLEERSEPSEITTGPAALLRAQVQWVRDVQEVTGYFELVYSAFRHNLAPRYRVILERPILLPGEPRPVRAIELQTGYPVLQITAEARLLDGSLAEIRRVAFESFRRRKFPEGQRIPFLRGDFDTSGRVDLADAAGVLRYLFQRGEASSCPDAADADDDGRLTVSDAIRLLLHLFGGQGPLPYPSARCGRDVTYDVLGCSVYSACTEN